MKPDLLRRQPDWRVTNLKVVFAGFSEGIADLPDLDREMIRGSLTEILAEFDCGPARFEPTEEERWRDLMQRPGALDYAHERYPLCRQLLGRFAVDTEPPPHPESERPREDTARETWPALAQILRTYFETLTTPGLAWLMERFQSAGAPRVVPDLMLAAESIVVRKRAQALVHREPVQALCRMLRIPIEVSLIQRRWLTSRRDVLRFLAHASKLFHPWLEVQAAEERLFLDAFESLDKLGLVTQEGEGGQSAYAAALHDLKRPTADDSPDVLLTPVRRRAGPFYQVFPTQKDEEELIHAVQVHVLSKLKANGGKIAARRDYEFYNDLTQEVLLRLQRWEPRTAERSIYFGAIEGFVERVRQEFSRTRLRHPETPAGTHIELVEAPRAASPAEEAEVSAVVRNILQDLPSAARVRLQEFLRRIEAGEGRDAALRASARSAGVSKDQMRRHVRALRERLTKALSSSG